MTATAPGAVDGTRNLAYFSSEHAWVRVANTILDRIASGEYCGRLPSQDAIAGELGVSRNTVQRAEGKLVAVKVIYRVGSAYYLWPVDAAGEPPDPRLWVLALKGLRIRIGKLEAYDLVPPKRQLARDLGVSRHAVGRALGILRGEGLITLERGNGYYVSAAAGSGRGQQGGRAGHEHRRPAD